MSMRRHKFNLNHYVFNGGRIGTLTPILRQEVIPGDTWYGKISVLCRLKSLAEPVMHPAFFDVHYFYVPNRIIWDGWEAFITESTGTIPTIDVTQSQAGFFMYGRSSDTDATKQTVSDLYVRAYNLIWNEFFRDQDFDTELALTSLDTQQARELKNYATKWRKDIEQFEVEIESEEFTVSSSKGTATIQATDVRDAMRDLRLAERRAMFGERYIDVLRSWGIKTNYQWLDRPEYLGRSRNIVSFSDIPATATSTNVTVGDLYGHGVCAVRHNFKRRVFPEHGQLVGVAVMRFVPLFTGQKATDASKSVPSDFWAPEYEMQTPEPYNTSQAGVDPTTDSRLGYLPKFEEYRTQPNYISGNLVDANYFADKKLSATNTGDYLVVNSSTFDRLFNDTKATNPHFQLHVHNKLHAIRQVSRVRTS